MTTHLRALAAALALLSAAALAQPTVPPAAPPAQAPAATPAPTPGSAPGPGMGPGSGMGPGAGMGPGKGMGPATKGGRGLNFSPRNTPGWAMMSAEEREEHQKKMLGMQNLADCKAYLDEHRKLMDARAQERKLAAPRGPRTDMCERMKQRGRIK